MDYQALWTELAMDPTAIGYVDPTNPDNDRQNATLINTTVLSVPRTTINTYEILEATVPADYAALVDGEKQRYQTFISAGMVDPYGENIVAAFQAMFAGTDTLSNLLAIRIESRIRSDILGFGRVYPRHIEIARNRYGG